MDTPKKKTRRKNIAMLVLFQPNIRDEAIDKIFASMPLDELAPTRESLDADDTIYSRFCMLYCTGYRDCRACTLRYSHFRSDASFNAALTYLKLSEAPIFRVFRVDDVAFESLCRIWEMHERVRATVITLTGIFLQKEVCRGELRGLLERTREKPLPSYARRNLKKAGASTKAFAEATGEAEQAMIYEQSLLSVLVEEQARKITKFH